MTDLDSDAVSSIKDSTHSAQARVVIRQENFREIERLTREEGISSLDRVVLDLGFSSMQLDGSGRGFSFQKNEPLIMTFRSSPDKGDLTALDVVNTWKEESLADIFWGFGGERRARKVAAAIVNARQEKRITQTGQLVRIITDVLGGTKGKIHPATKIFQAIRMAVNDELGSLKKVLNDGWRLLVAGGRIVVISFHEGEDREVKSSFRRLEESGLGLILTRKPLEASGTELAENPRARSAKLRAISKLALA